MALYASPSSVSNIQELKIACFFASLNNVCSAACQNAIKTKRNPYPDFLARISVADYDPTVLQCNWLLFMGNTSYGTSPLLRLA